MQASQESVAYQIGRFLALTLLFGLLNYTGTALYFTADGITTVKPFSGVALALLLINGRRWLWPVLISGTVGAIIAKATFRIEPAIFTVPLITSGALFLVHHFCQKWIGEKIDFRAWKQLVLFIAIAAAVSVLSSLPYALGARLWNGHQILGNLQAWVVPTTLSYVIFTPVIVLLATAERGVFSRNWQRHLAAQCVLLLTLALNLLPVGPPLIPFPGLVIQPATVNQFTADADKLIAADVIIPEPSTVLLLVLGGMLAAAVRVPRISLA